MALQINTLLHHFQILQVSTKTIENTKLFDNLKSTTIISSTTTKQKHLTQKMQFCGVAIKEKKKSTAIRKIFYTLLTTTGIILMMLPQYTVIGTSSVYIKQKHFLFLNLKAVNILREQRGLKFTCIQVNKASSFCLPAIRILGNPECLGQFQSCYQPDIEEKRKAPSKLR